MERTKLNWLGIPSQHDGVQQYLPVEEHSVILLKVHEEVNDDSPTTLIHLPLQSQYPFASSNATFHTITTRNVSVTQFMNKTIIITII